MSEADPTPVCCPPFDPEPWDETTREWHGRRFLKERVRCFLHVPINFGSVMKRSMAKIEAAGAKPEDRDHVLLTEDTSLWGTDLYLSVTRDVPGAEMVTLEGTFMSKVYEGPYKMVPGWMRDMASWVRSRGREPRRTYTYYTTCPRCAKKYGKNYVVMLARVA